MHDYPRFAGSTNDAVAFKSIVTGLVLNFALVLLVMVINWDTTTRQSRLISELESHGVAINTLTDSNRDNLVSQLDWIKKFHNRIDQEFIWFTDLCRWIEDFAIHHEFNDPPPPAPPDPLPPPPPLTVPQIEQLTRGVI